MAEQHAIPTKASQPKVDDGMEISPDGGIITSLAAPSSARRLAPAKEASTMAEAPTVDETGNEVTTEKPAEEVKPVVEQEAPAVEETPIEKVADFTDFLKIKETGELTDEIQKTKLAEEDKSKVSEEDKAKQDKAKEVAPKTVLDKTVAQRDYSDLDQELAPLFKTMSNDSFNKLKPIILEHKKLKEQVASQTPEIERLRKGAIPDSYYDNPSGFVLDPEYQKAEMSVSQAQSVLHHWQQQFKAVRDGAAEFTLAQFDNNGNLVPVQKVAAGKDAEIQIMQVVNNAQQQLFKVAGKAEAIRGTFKARHSNALGWLNNYENKAFQIFNTEQGKQFEPQLKSILDEFPAEFKGHPLAKVLAKSIATNVHLATLLVQNAPKPGTTTPAATTTKTVNGKPSTAKEQQRRAGPTVADTGAPSRASAVDDKNDVSFDDFQRVKEES